MMHHRKRLLAFAFLAVLLAPGAADAASTTGSAILGLAVGAVAGVYGLPLILPSAVAAAPAVVTAVSNAATTVGTAIVTNPEWAGAILGGFFGLWLAP